MAIIAYLLYAIILKATKKSLLAEIVGSVVGAIVMTFGYFIYETLFFSTATVAIVNVPWNLLQGAIGVVISASVMRILTATKILEKIQN